MPVSAEALEAAMRTASAESETVRGSTYPNPPVGAVLLSEAGDVVGIGATEPPGGAHAEIVALRRAGARARGATAVVTLEPCNHHGRTGPCTEALIEAGVAAVHFAVTDPNPLAAGGMARLAAAGVDVHGGLLAEEIERGPLRAWLHRQRTGRPHVTWKFAASLDGRSAAVDGSSRWVTGEQARNEVHAERAKLDAIVVGTGTVLRDDPWLTARTPEGALAAHQPLRVVVGKSEISSTAQVFDDSAPTLRVRTNDPHEVLDALAGHTDVLLEGGPRLAGAFLAHRCVDRVLAYLAPVVLGAGPAAVEGAGVDSIEAALRFRREYVRTVGDDIVLSLIPESNNR